MNDWTPTYKPKYLAFVDFDGVLTNARVQMGIDPKRSYSGWAGFDPVVMQFFNRMHDKFDHLHFVWTTSWRNRVEESMMTEHWAYSMWYNAGFRGLFADPWRVNPKDVNEHGDLRYNLRAEEIQHYLDNYGQGVKDFIIFDDTDYKFNEVLGVRRFIKTDALDGMLTRHMRDAWAMMGTWDPRES